MIRMEYHPEKGIWAEDEQALEKLRYNFMGWEKNGKIFLHPEEALYILNFQNGVCEYKGKKDKTLDFNQLATIYAKEEPKLFIKYNAIREWRDRGLIIQRLEQRRKKGRKKSYKKYPAQKLKKKKLDTKTIWYPESVFSILEDSDIGRELYEKHWLGQHGIYKQDRGEMSKLNFLETVFLSRHFGLKIEDAETGKKLKPEDILNQLEERRKYTRQLYDVYEDWRLKNFVVKTGFKFGSHFRVYFPGASPVKSGKWVHSKHVLHVFPKEQRMLISEWARVIRLAHSVKKTFILAIPKMKKKDYVDYPAHFVAYRRKKEKGDWVRETPEDRPRFLVSAVSEDEQIGGVELASLLKKAQDLGLELILSITDRESSVTYYLLKKILIGDSDYEYYEIEWMRP